MDGVPFKFLHPPADYFISGGNNASCVLRVGEPGHCLLLTADIEKTAERTLLANHAEELACPVVLTPHHGSLTSSTPEFIAAARPQVAVVTSARNNRYGFPKEPVVERYETRGAAVLNTAATGALSFRFAPRGGFCVSGAHRPDRRRYWHLTRPMRHNVAAPRCRT